MPFGNNTGSASNLQFDIDGTGNIVGLSDKSFGNNNCYYPKCLDFNYIEEPNGNYIYDASNPTST